MKRRMISILCVLAVCAGFLAMTVSLGAANDPCFMAVNDTLLPLDSDYMPITVEGQYYVPYTALDSTATGVRLGIYPFYSTINNSLMIYTRDLSLTFDLSTGICTDQSGAVQTARAVTRNGRIYVPARFVCEHFGLAYSSRNTEFGPLVRLRTGTAKWGDAQFVEQAQNLMAERLRDWRRAQTEPSEVSPSPTASPTPSVTPSAPAGQDADKSGVTMYLAFRADRTDGLDSLLTRLEFHQIHALFFFPAQELADYDEAVRKVLCGGHAVGLILTGEGTEENAGQLQRGNDLLTRIAHINTYTVLADDPDAAAECGALCWTTDVDALPGDDTPARQAAVVLKAADLCRKRVCILSDASAEGTALMKQFLPAAIELRYSIRLAVETEL